MLSFTTERALIAATALVYLAIGFGTLAFWSTAFTSGDWIDFLIAALLTITFGSVSFLLSGAVIRFAEAKDRNAGFTAFMVVVLGGVLGLIEAGMTHQGLHWLDAHKDFAPGWVLVIASFGLSAFNIFALYVFARDIPKVEGVRPTVSADEAVFGGQPEQPLAPVIDLFKAPPAQPVRFGTADQLHRNQAAIAAIREQMGAAN